MTVYKKDNPIFFKTAVDSMLDQTYRTNDFVLVCDGPVTDELNKYIDEYEKKYTKLFNVIRCEENIGLGAALKKGILHCKNDIVARMDSDDIAAPTRCEVQIKRFENDNKLVLLGSYMNEFVTEKDANMRLKKVPTEYSDIMSFSKRRNPFNHSTVMFRKKAVQEVGNYSEMRTNQDVELWVRMLNSGYKAENIPEALVDFRFDNNTYKRRKNWKNVKLLLKVWKEFLKKGYCSLTDYIVVLCIQIAMYIMPTKVIVWCYNHMR